ncbi:MAG: FtsW/RodA/SpoVE family cell cycle protein [Bacteroidales bacterium]|nr:FtsW/RodA/SpoVE family cell cycle protein [Bacteroidales bacterium]MDD4703530.1 FtsW/RodA/SpoVE family cell cycle protein [Bacteroidales bacterium]
MQAGRFKIKIQGDKVIWMVFLLLMIISAMEVYSTIGKTVYERQGGSPITMFAKHIFILLLGTCVLYAVHHIKYTYFSRFAKIGLIISFILLTLTLILGSFGDKAAARWLTIPLIGQFQPSEIVKIILIIYVARILALNQEKIKSTEVFQKLIIPIVLICLLIFPENFSTATLLFLICYFMMFIGRVNNKFLISILIIGIIGLMSIYFVLKSNPDLLSRGGTWVNRIEEFLSDDKTAITQSNQAEMAIATGGVFGKFLGHTTQARFLSESHNDFIFAIIVEEGGLILGIVVIALYLILLFRGIQVARRSKGYFGTFCSIGLIIMIVFQAMINMCVATGLLPVTGQTLPFISYGGTSFLFSCIALGIVLSISASANKEQAKEKLEKDIVEEEVSEDPSHENNNVE